MIISSGVPSVLIGTVDVDACVPGATPCEGLDPVGAASTNANPVRLVVQRQGPTPAALLGPEAFEIRQQFGPPGATAVALECPTCFEARDGDTYSIWLHPTPGNWTAGAYFLWVDVRHADRTLPALVRFDIPWQPPEPPPPPPPPDCGNYPPTAVIAGPDTIHIQGAPGQLVQVLLDGSLSSDSDGLIRTYTWSCGNGSAPVLPGYGSKAVCSYRTLSVPKTYTATLVVVDNGKGTIDPSTGTWLCEKHSEEDSVQVEVSPLE